MRFALNIWLVGCMAAASLALGGCSGEKPAESAPAAKKSATASRKPAAASPEPARLRSTFTADVRSRDPFFPNAKRGPDPVVAAVGGEPANAEKLLRNGFQGVFGAGQYRLAMINNVMLERGRTAAIPVGSGTQRSEITVKVKDVLSNAVVLEVDGRTITISTTKL